MASRYPLSDQGTIVHLVSFFLLGLGRNVMMMSHCYPIPLLSLRPHDNFFFLFSFFTLLVFGRWLSLSLTMNVSKGGKHRMKVGVTGEIFLFLATDTDSPLTPCLSHDLGDTEQPCHGITSHGKFTELC